MKISAGSGGAPPHRRTKPKPQAPPAGVFGPLRRADAPITRAQHAAARRTQRARRPVEKGIVLPAVPTLAHPTRAQRRATANVITAAERHQGIHTQAEVRALPRAQRQRAEAGNRAAAIGRRQASRATLAKRRQLGLGAPTAVRLHENPAVHRLQVLGIDPGAIFHGLLGLTSLGSPTGENSFVKGAFGDVKSLAEAPFVGAYEIGAGAVDTIARHPVRGSLALLAGPLGVAADALSSHRGQQLAKGVAKGVENSLPGYLLRGDFKGAEKYAREHPVFAGLDVLGASDVAGGAAGSLARGLGSTIEDTGVRGALARAGTTIRRPIGLNVADGGTQVVERTFSKKLNRKVSQQAADSQREVLRDASGKVVTYRDPRAPNKPLPVLKALPGEERLLHARRVDFTASGTNASERYGREVRQREQAQAMRGGRVRGRVSRKAQHAVSMAVQGILREDHAASGTTFAADVEKRITHLRGQLAKVGTDRNPYRHSGEVGRARDEVKVLEKLRGLAPEQVTRLFKAKDAIGRARVLQDAEEARLGLAPAGQLERARLEVYAASHMDARHFTVEEHQALERKARVVEKQLRAKVESAPAKSAERAKALAEWRQARDERIAVSGREPAGVHGHEHAARQAARADKAVAGLEDQIAKLERRRQQLIGSNRVRRGANVKTAAKGAKQIEKVNADLKRLREQRKAARKAQGELRGAASAAKLPETQAAIRTRDGKFLSNADIKSHMVEHGVDPATIGQLSHRELGSSAFHRKFTVNRGQVSGERRTLAAHERGAGGFGRDQVEESGVGASTLISRAQSVDQFISDNALKHPAVKKAERGQKLSEHEQRVVDRGGGFTPKEAVETAQRIEKDTGRVLIPVRMRAARTPAADLIDQLQLPGAMEAYTRSQLGGRVVTELLNGSQKTALGKKLRELINTGVLEHGVAGDRGARNIALVDARDIKRLARHAAPAGALEQLVQMLNRPFRFSVLAQPRWLTGNFVEPYFIRLPASGSGIINIPGMAMDIARSVKTLRAMERSGDPAVRAAAARIRAQHLGGLFIGGRGASVRRRLTDTDSKFVHAGAFIRNMPVVKQIGDLLHIPPDAYFRANRQLIEKWAQHASLGRSIRKDLEALHGSWMKAWSLGDAAVKDAERGLVNTATQERFMRAQHELLGKYEGFSPEMRRIVQTVSPFLPWALSAARFVFWTMPAHHTILTNLLTRSASVFAQSWNAEHKDAPPGGLRLAVRTKDGGYVDLARYTPYGFSGPIVEGDLQGISDEFMPQVSGTIAAFQGKDAFGRDLRVNPTKGNPQGIPSIGQKIGIAFYSLLEATGGPYTSLIRRIEEHGETPYSNSTVFAPQTKPNTSYGQSGLRRALDPFRPVHLKSKTGGPGGGVPAAERRALLREAAHEKVTVSDSERKKLLHEAALAARGG